MESSLKEVLHEVSSSFTPIPPPLDIAVDEKAPTFSVDLIKMLVTAPGYHSSLKHVRELIGHEVKHVSRDGLPYTWRNELWFEAALMKSLNKPLEVVKNILNVVFDAVVDLRVDSEGLDVKGACEEWLKHFPITPEAEGSAYHLLQILYSDFFGIKLPKTKYEEEVKRTRYYGELKAIIKDLASGNWEDNRYSVVRAGVLVDLLARVDVTKMQGDLTLDRGDPNVRAEAAEIGIEMGLNDRRLAELMGVGLNELREELEKAAEDKVRAAIWRGILGFRDLKAGASMLEVKEPVSEKWKPYSRSIDPESVAKNPDDPRRWRRKVKETVMAVEQEDEGGGFTKLIMLIDCSGSTESMYSERAVLSYIKDAAYGLLAYAKKMGLPVISIAYSDSAWILAGESRNYVEHGKRIFMLRSRGGTNLLSAVRLASLKKPEKALLALITDGLVSPDHIEEFSKQSKISRAVVAVVDADARGVETVKAADPSVQIFIVKPDSAGRTIISALPKNRA